MRYIPVVLLFSLLPAAAPQDSSYQVSFRGFTAFGDPVAIRVVALADPLHQRDLAAHCSGAVCTGIPEGPYSYSVSIPETNRRVDGSAVIYRTNQVIPVDVGTPAGDLDDSDFPDLAGKVLHVADPSKVWIRLEQLYADGSVSARIEKDGSFQLDQVRPGNWMLLVFNDGKLVHFEPLVCKATGNAPVKIDLSLTEPPIKARKRDAPFLSQHLTSAGE
jgi:hypothetical protein